MTFYKGWDYTHSPSAPITGQWQARQKYSGITICAGSETELRRMIDRKAYEAMEETARRQS